MSSLGAARGSSFDVDAGCRLDQGAGLPTFLVGLPAKLQSGGVAERNERAANPDREEHNEATQHITRHEFKGEVKRCAGAPPSAPAPWNAPHKPRHSQQLARAL
jgi:hypothetical protein